MHLVLARFMKVIEGVFSNTWMSPAKHRQQTSSAKNGSKMKHGGYGGMCLPVTPLHSKALKIESDLQCASTEMSPVEHSHMWVLVAFKWYTKEKWGEIDLTGALGVIQVDRSHRRRVLKHLKVTCETSTTDIISGYSTKDERRGDVLSSEPFACARIESW